MKKKILSLIFISILVVGLTTGCGKGAQKEYSDAIKKERSSTILLLGDHNIGEYLDYVLKDYEWTEDDSFSGKVGDGAVIVKGKDRKTGSSVEIVLVKNVTQGGSLSNVEYIKCNGKDVNDYMTCDGQEYGYQKFLSYLAEYKNDVEEYYSSNDNE